MRVRRRLTSLALHSMRDQYLRVDTSTARLVVSRVGPLVTRRCIIATVTSILDTSAYFGHIRTCHPQSRGLMILNLESFRTTGGNDEPSTGKEAAKLYILMLIEELLDGWREW